MTVITVGENSIEVKGHATQKVVCHGVSAICNMVANYVLDNQWGNVEKADGYLKIFDVEEKYLGNDLFIAMMIALKDIQTEYPDNIEINYLCSGDV